MNERSHWWATRWYVALLLLTVALPLLWPVIPPLEDMPGHLARFRIQGDLSQAPTLAQTFSIHWLPIGNLGVDLPVLALQPLFGVEPAAKAVVIAIPVIWSAGLLLTIREAHGELPATAAFALPLAYAYPFQFGFINFWLASGVALLAFGLVLRYQRLGRANTWRLLVLFGSIVIYFAHIFGWVFFGLLIGGNALYRHLHDKGIGWPALRSIIAEGLLLCLPLVLIVLWRSNDNQGETSAYFDIFNKWGWIESAVRERWVQWDGLAALGCAGLIALGVVTVLDFNARLLVVFAVVAAFYIFIPYAFHGLIYADMRLAPLTLALGIAALAPRPGWGTRFAAVIAMLALGFVLARTATTTVNYAHFAQEQDRYLAALAHIPRGARVVAFVYPPCPRGWSGPRISHLASMAIVRRDAFVNDQFEMPGAQLVEVGPAIPRAYAYHNSAMVRLPGCDRPEPLLTERIAQVPREAFDHVWLIGVDGANRPNLPWLGEVWSNNRSAVYEISRAEAVP